MAFLSDDLLEGRGTGTRGYQLAATYVASEFERLGLKPGGDRGTFFQSVRYRRRDVVSEQTSVTATHPNGTTHRLRRDKDFVSFGDPLRENATAQGPVVFVGFGVTAPEFDYDDYRDADVKGKLVAMVVGAPDKFPPAVRAHHSSSFVKAQNAVAHGALGVIFIWAGAVEKQTPFSEMVRFSRQLKMNWLDRDGTPNDTFPSLRTSGTMLSAAGATPLFDGARRSFADALAAAATSEPQAFPLPVSMSLKVITKYTDSESPNVAAILPGSDPALRDEYVVVTAHLDHEGIGEPINGDSIYNGALDNASGTAAMLEIAQALASKKPAPGRAILFLSVGGEEAGLLGSDYYARHPTVPPRSLAANVNMDGMAFLYDFADIIAFGAEHSSLGPVVGAVAKGLGLELSPDPLPEEVFFIRSDQYSFVKQGVPAVMISDGFKAVDPKVDGKKMALDWFAKYYHTPQDDMRQPLNFEAMAKSTRVNLAVVAAIADTRDRPAWNRGDFFERFVSVRR